MFLIAVINSVGLDERNVLSRSFIRSFGRVHMVQFEQPTSFTVFLSRSEARNVRAVPAAVGKLLLQLSRSRISRP